MYSFIALIVLAEAKIHEDRIQLTTISNETIISTVQDFKPHCFKQHCHDELTAAKKANQHFRMKWKCLVSQDDPRSCLPSTETWASLSAPESKAFQCGVDHSCLKVDTKTKAKSLAEQSSDVHAPADTSEDAEDTANDAEIDDDDEEETTVQAPAHEEAPAHKDAHVANSKASKDKNYMEEATKAVQGLGADDLKVVEKEVKARLEKLITIQSLLESMDNDDLAEKKYSGDELERRKQMNFISFMQKLSTQLQGLSDIEKIGNEIPLGQHEKPTKQSVAVSADGQVSNLRVDDAE